MKTAFPGSFWLVLAAVAIPPLALVTASSPAAAQFSAAYRFIQGVRDRDYSEVQPLIERSGTTVINTKDRDSGESALHIVVRRRDTEWLLYLLRNHASPNTRDRDGNTPLHLASQMGFSDAVHWLNLVNADVNAANNRGETPLILAVQQRNSDVVRRLITAGANPDIADSIVGMSARDYATRDRRGAAILGILNSAQPSEEAAESVGPSID